MNSYLLASITLMLLAFIQSVSFSVVSRSRNRSSIKFHLVAAFFSNSIWFLTFRSLVKAKMSLGLFPWYCAGTMLGSTLGVKVSMWIEKKVGASADAHVAKQTGRPYSADLIKQVEGLKERVQELEYRAAPPEERA